MAAFGPRSICRSSDCGRAVPRFPIKTGSNACGGDAATACKYYKPAGLPCEGRYVFRRARRPQRTGFFAANAGDSDAVGKGETRNCGKLTEEEGLPDSTSLTPVEPGPGPGQVPAGKLGSTEPDAAEIDRQIAVQWAPALLNMMLIPLSGAVDVFWIGRMQEPLALAGQGAANQVFNALFWIIGFLPTLVTPQVAKSAAQGDSAKLQDYVGEALLLSALLGLVGCLIIVLCPDLVISPVGLSPSSEVSSYALSYLKYRALGFIPALCSMVCFATFRGVMDPVTPLRISIFSQVLNAVLDPLLIFGVPRLGVPALGVGGAAMATTAAEVASFAIYISLMLRKQLVSLSGILKLPTLSSLVETVKGAGAIQLRSLVMTSTFMCVTRAVLKLDPSGMSAAAHTVSLQIFTLGSVAMLALSNTATALIPQWLNKGEGGGVAAAKRVADRLLQWGLLSGISLCVLQALLIVPVLKVITPLAAVQSSAVAPCMLGAGLHAFFGLGCVAEGIQQGHQAYSYLAFQNIVASVGVVVSLHFLGSSLAGIWLSYWVFHSMRVMFSVHHHLFLSPLAPTKQRSSMSAA